MKKLILTIIILLAITAVKSQNDYQYSYDVAGNRTCRAVIVLRNTPPPIDSTKNKTDSTQLAKDNKDNEKYESVLGEQKITVFPNPTKGELKIDITNLPSATTGLIIITDMQGRVIYENKNITSTNMLDISSTSAGNYVLKIIVDNKTKEWVLMKQ
ncbi:MAG: T9SS type A sorting domain-containing protein [Bacteroidales bacterium]|jgi:hypothetical protein